MTTFLITALENEIFYDRIKIEWGCTAFSVSFAAKDDEQDISIFCKILLELEEQIVMILPTSSIAKIKTALQNLKPWKKSYAQLY
jgi:hypothetical protein